MDQIKIGKFISSCRKAQGLTQVQFAEKLGVTNKAVSKWETGKCLPDAALFSDICLLLDITINEFFAGEKIPPEEIVAKAEENLLGVVTEYQKQHDYHSALSMSLFGISMSMVVASVIFSNILVKTVWLIVAIALFGFSCYRIGIIGGRLFDISKIISLIALAISVLCSVDFGINFAASLVSNMNDGIGTRSFLHGLFRVFGDRLWSQEKFYFAFEYSLWISFAVMIENIVLALYVRHHNTNKPKSK